MTNPTARRRVVVVTPELPHQLVPHAGGRYVATLVEVLQSGAEVVVLAPDSPVNRAAEQAPGLPARYAITGRRSTRPAWLRPVFRVLALADRARARRDPSVLPASVVAGLLTSPTGRAALRSADVVDLQWGQTARLERLVRLLNHHARVIATFHDVRSERFRRSAAREPDPVRSRGLLRAARAEERVQSRLVRRLDAAITFSDKDAVQLDPAGGAHVTVVPPPLADLLAPARRPWSEPLVVFVGHLARPENEDAVLWLLDAVWPLVRAAVPSAQLRVVGGGAGDRLAQRLRTEASVHATGYVDDLATQYAQAWLCVVPVRDGAGVKFKTVEAMVAGVPVVTTIVGAEGVAEAAMFAGCTDDPGDFAGACVAVLRDHLGAQDRASDVARWARDRFSRSAFERTVRRLYLNEG